jgi:hypothetical protein
LCSSTYSDIAACARPHGLLFQPAKRADRSLSPAGRRVTPWGASAPLRPKYAPLLPLRGWARASTPIARITSPCGACHAGPLARASGRAGRPCLATVQALAQPRSGGGGAAPPVELGSVGAATGLDAPYVRRLPLSGFVPLGRERHPGQRAAWRSPQCVALDPRNKATRTRSCAISATCCQRIRWLG